MMDSCALYIRHKGRTRCLAAQEFSAPANRQVSPFYRLSEGILGRRMASEQESGDPGVSSCSSAIVQTFSAVSALFSRKLLKKWDFQGMPNWNMGCRCPSGVSVVSGRSPMKVRCLAVLVVGLFLLLLIEPT